MRFTLVPSRVIGPITIRDISGLSWEYTTKGRLGASKDFSYTISTSSLAGTYVYLWIKKAVIVKHLAQGHEHLAQGHKCHERESNPHPNVHCSKIDAGAIKGLQFNSCITFIQCN